MIKAPKDLSDEKAWFWYSVKWYVLSSLLVALVIVQSIVLYRLVTK